MARGELASFCIPVFLCQLYSPEGPEVLKCKTVCELILQTARAPQDWQAVNLISVYFFFFLKEGSSGDGDANRTLWVVECHANGERLLKELTKMRSLQIAGR